MQRPSFGTMIFGCANPDHNVAITIETGDVQEVGRVTCSCGSEMEYVAMMNDDE